MAGVWVAEVDEYGGDQGLRWTLIPFHLLSLFPGAVCLFSFDGHFACLLLIRLGCYSVVQYLPCSVRTLYKIP